MRWRGYQVSLVVWSISWSRGYSVPQLTLVIPDRFGPRTEKFCPCWVTAIFVTLGFNFKVNLFGQQVNDENNHVYIMTQNKEYIKF